MLNPVLFNEIDELHKGLEQPFLVIENALVPEMAERLYKDLLDFQGWAQQDEGVSSGLKPKQLEIQAKLYPQYKFQRRYISLGKLLAPDSVNEFYRYLKSEEMFDWIYKISDRTCDDFNGAATLYGESDYISEHSDYYITESDDGRIITRSVTFNYYLTKGWKPGWGGRFIWNNPYAEFTPTFNTLVMFLVGRDGFHHVEAVTKDADQPRLAITGWYLTAREKASTQGRKLNLKY